MRRDIDRNLSKQWDPQSFRFAFAAAAAKNVVTLLIARRNEVAHIFDQAKDGHVYFLEHGCRLARVDQCHFLRRGHDNRARQRNSLDDGKLDRKSTRLNSSHVAISYAVFCLKKK